MQTSPLPLILASASQVRKTMLEEAGLDFIVLPSPYDEEAQKTTLNAFHPKEQAALLADGKAAAVSALHPHAYVIGADQICALDRQIFGKPHNAARAASHLQALQGKTHHQYSAACVYYQGKPVWADVEVVTLTMKPLNAAQIDEYIAKDEPFAACGAYRYEATGHTLFSHIDGTAAAIKGLPLNGLLAFLS